MNAEMIIRAIVGLVAVAVFLHYARKPHQGIQDSSKAARWTAFILSALAGFIAVVVLWPIVSWVLKLDGGFAWIGSIGAIVGLTLGWYALTMGTSMVRDLADGVPDKEAQRAALYIPTCLPAGWGSVAGVISNPTGIGSTITAAIMSGISVFFCVKIVQEALKNKQSKHYVKWLYYAAVVSFLGGLCAVPLVAKIDDFLADHVPAEYMTWGRVIGGVIGAAMLIGAFADAFQKHPHPDDRSRTIRKPDQHVRTFGLVGLPLCYLFFSVGYAWLSDTANSGFDKFSGTVA
ncbi:hypothetical protein I0C86_40695 [Plantactinospora sp. S1510]|uniref:Uncharacterized protein n=1 Tax=Plantactinospora alkalitolerans TaxID=2789879 RepID=A0ABS0H9P6_9ACTN|nr:hypothetical protein [Plantactinospora alkalitolerans]MBF9135200.1 hypothetical protein [Plantactinospora alkalitolerans]